jgi:hypothetical protein
MVSSTGFVSVLTRGEVDITATSGGLSPRVWSALVDPQQSPQVLYFLSGIIRETMVLTRVISGAAVEILDGYNAGPSVSSVEPVWRIPKLTAS